LADHTRRFARHHGFLTLWALFFLASVSLLLSVVGVGLAARRETTNQLVRDYSQSTQKIVHQTRQLVKKRAQAQRHQPAKADSPQRLLE